MMKDLRQQLRAAPRIPSRLTALITAAALLAAPVAHAQENRGPPLLRDAEIEQLLREYTRPILRAAGLEKQNIQVVIINNGSFNAFVADGRRIFDRWPPARWPVSCASTPISWFGVVDCISAP